MDFGLRATCRQSCLAKYGHTVTKSFIASGLEKDRPTFISLFYPRTERDLQGDRSPPKGRAHPHRPPSTASPNPNGTHPASVRPTFTNTPFRCLHVDAPVRPLRRAPRTANPRLRRVINGPGCSPAAKSTEEAAAAAEGRVRASRPARQARSRLGGAAC